MVQNMVKGRKIVDPLSEGLPSRIYLAAYPEPKTSYQIAKMILSGSRARDAAGRVGKTIIKYREYFDIKHVRVSELKVKALIHSRVQPLLDRLVEECRLEPSEKKMLEGYLETDFRVAVGEHLRGLLKGSPGFLSREVNAFETLTGLLGFIFYIAKIYISAPEPVRKFASTIVSRVAPRIVGEEESTIERYIGLVSELPKRVPPNIIIKVYEKMMTRIKIPPEMVPDVLQLLEDYINVVGENPKLILEAIKRMREQT